MQKKKVKDFKDKLLKNKWYIKFQEIREKILEKINSNLKYQLTFLVAVCFLVSIIVGFITTQTFFAENRKIISTEIDVAGFNNDANNFATNLNYAIEEGKVKESDSKFFVEALNGNTTDLNTNHSVYITNLEGKVIYKKNGASENQFSIYGLLTKINEGNLNERQEYTEESVNTNINTSSAYSTKEYTRIFPLKIEDGEYYLIYEGVPSVMVDTKIVRTTNNVLGFVIGVLCFIGMFIYLINKKVKYLDEISDGIKVIASGNLEHRINLVGNDEVSNIANNINTMAAEINDRIEAQKASEKTKTELITNVSHDLRTPLTSIMGYIGLLKDKRYKNKEEMEEYLEIAFNKSENLKSLIEDLFEYTKLNNISNSEMKINKTKIDLSNLISQIGDEMIPVFEKNDLILVKNIVDEKLICNVDPEKMVRVLENLLTNACKYSYKPGTVVMGIYKNDNSAIISVRNRGDNIDEEKLKKLFERFYRVDEARTTDSGGTGLGLAIAKTIVNMHGGDLWAECLGNDITFYIKLEISSN